MNVTLISVPFDSAQRARRMGNRPARPLCRSIWTRMIRGARAAVSALALRVANLTAFDPDVDTGKAMQDTAIALAVAICKDVAVSLLAPRPTEPESSAADERRSLLTQAEICIEAPME